MIVGATDHGTDGKCFTFIDTSHAQGKVPVAVTSTPTMMARTITGNFFQAVINTDPLIVRPLLFMAVKKRKKCGLVNLLCHWKYDKTILL